MMCEQYKVSRSGFYAWQRRPASARTTAINKLSERIKEIHNISHEAYGSPRIYATLKQQGISCGRKKVARLMREMGIAGRASRLYWRNAGNHTFFQRHGNEKLNMDEPSKIGRAHV